VSTDVVEEAHLRALRRVLELTPAFVKQFERDARTVHWPEELAGGLLDARALHFAARAEVPTAGEMARVLWVSESALTAVLNRLEQSGLIVRDRDRHDRRVVRVVVTERGREVEAEAEAIRMEHMRRHFGALSTPDLEQLAAIMERMIRAADSGLGGPEGRP
jgi:DNA-binding MarR family transcriptional regulator